jgi:hypothetical protein
MSRKPKTIPPIVGNFNDILSSIAMGSGKGKKTAIKLAREKVGALRNPTQSPKK